MENFYTIEEVRVAGIVDRLTPIPEPPADERRSWSKVHTTAFSNMVKKLGIQELKSS